MKLAIMQPYFFPYIGYFQLVKAVDKFVFYDDVNYINRGWINRNRILLGGQPHYFTVHLNGASQNKLINEIDIVDNRSKLRKTILNTYSKAPYFDEVWPLVENVLDFKTNKISELAAYSVIQISNYLGIDLKFEFSSKEYAQTAILKSEHRLIEICKLSNAAEYINPIGGVELYKKETFMDEGINLFFLRTGPITYNQFANVFVENLSIVDVIMFNSRSDTTLLLNNYELF